VTEHSGPEHKPAFVTKLYLTPKVRSVLRVQLGNGRGGAAKEAEQAAAMYALEQIIPRTTAGKLPPIASRFWKSYFDRLEDSPGVIVGACGVEHFKNLNSFTAFFGLKAFSSCLPDLSPYLRTPSFLKTVRRSIGRLAVVSPQSVFSLGKRGIALITKPAPDDLKAFSDPGIEGWLAEIRRAAVVLKLPPSEIRSPMKLIPVSDFAYVRDWKLLISGADSLASISEPMFSHVVTLLETLGRDAEENRNEVEVAVDAAPDWRAMRLSFKKPEWSRLQLEQVIGRLWQHAFFSGVSNTVKEGEVKLSLDVKGLCLQTEEPHVTAYVEIMRDLYGAQSSFKSLYRIIHDLKNQVIAIRNYAVRAATEGKGYQTFAAIEQLQQKIRNREAALSLFFRTADQITVKRIKLQRTVRDFIARQVPNLPDAIRLDFKDSLDRLEVIANEEFIVSLLENLTANAIEAMPKGGLLSISASYSAADSMLEIMVSDTGVGIPSEAIPELFTSLKSTKATGMGLGLATVKQIVEQYDGLIDVTSALGTGTKFTVLLPLRKAS